MSTTTTKKRKTKPEQPETAAWASTAAEWRGRNVHDATLPSTTQVTFRRVPLGWLITNGMLPRRLRELAAAEYADPGAGAKRLHAVYDAVPEDAPEERWADADEIAQGIGKDLAELNRELVAAALIEPAVTADDLASPDFPLEDLEMLAGILTGLVVVDAAGRCVGVAPLDDFVPFRHEHGCGPDCEDCKRARWPLSTARRGEAL